MCFRRGFEWLLRYILKITISNISENRTDPVRVELPLSPARDKDSERSFCYLWYSDKGSIFIVSELE